MRLQEWSKHTGSAASGAGKVYSGGQLGVWKSVCVALGAGGVPWSTGHRGGKRKTVAKG